MLYCIGIYSFLNWLAIFSIFNGDIYLLLPSSLISHGYVVYTCLIIVSVWCQVLHIMSTF